MSLDHKHSSLALHGSLADAVAALAADARIEHDEAQQLVLMGERLRLSGLSRWCCALLAVFGRYRGLEQYIPPGQGPMPQILDWLNQPASQLQELPDAAVAAELAQLDFTFYRVRASGMLWDVTQCSLRRFASEDHLTVWESDRQHPARDVLIAFLLGQLEQPCRA